MHSVSRFLAVVAILSPAAAAAAPAFVQPVPTIQHVSVHYEPKSVAYCIEAAALDAGATGAAQLPSRDCRSRAAWADDGFVLTRR